MENIEEVKRVRDLFEEGKITQDEINMDMQRQIANLYKSEIESIREDIYATRKDIALCNEMINNVEGMQRILDNYNKNEE